MKAGKHTYDKQSALHYLSNRSTNTFSINIFKWLLKADGVNLKPSKCIVRVTAPKHMSKQAFAKADEIVAELNEGTYKGNQHFRLK